MTNKLSEPELFYLRHNLDKSLDDLAAALGRSPGRLKGVVAQLKAEAAVAAPAEQAAVATKVERSDTHFARAAGSTSYTGSQSKLDDETAGGTNAAFKARFERCIHRMEP
jgi:hypothetical protein